MSITLLYHNKTVKSTKTTGERYIQQLATLPKSTRAGTKKQDGETLSPSTVRRYLTVLQSTFKQAVKLGLIPDTPAKAEKLTIPKAKQPTISFNSPLTASSFSCIMLLDIFLSHFECLLATFILPEILEYVYSFLRNLLYLISSAANIALCDRKNGRTSLYAHFPVRLNLR